MKRQSLSVYGWFGLVILILGCGSKQTQVEAPKLAPANPEAVSTMAKGVEAAKTREGVPQAIGLFQKAVKADQKLWEAHYDLGILLAETGELDAAEATPETGRGAGAERRGCLGRAERSSPPARRRQRSRRCTQRVRQDTSGCSRGQGCADERAPGKRAYRRSHSARAGSARAQSRRSECTLRARLGPSGER